MTDDAFFPPDNWVTVPTNSTLTIHKQTVMIHPIVDEFYNHSPSYARSPHFAKEKGLVSSSPGEAQVSSAPNSSAGLGGISNKVSAGHGAPAVDMTNGHGHGNGSMNGVVGGSSVGNGAVESDGALVAPQVELVRQALEDYSKLRAAVKPAA